MLRLIHSFQRETGDEDEDAARQQELADEARMYDCVFGVTEGGTRGTPAPMWRRAEPNLAVALEPAAAFLPRRS